MNLTIALLQSAPLRYEVVTDSSKTAWHFSFAPIWLRRALQKNFLLVHIVRNPRAVCWSMLQKAQRKGERPNKLWRCVSTTFGWLVANFTCEVFGWLYPQQYVRLRYEDFVRSPRKDVDRILSILVPEGGERLDSRRAANNRHQLYGNRMRSNVSSFDDIKEDSAWQVDMSPHHKLLVGALTWPFYGYSGRANASQTTP